MQSNFYSFLDELRILAQVGLEYADDPYDEERYERILTRVSELYGQSVELPPAEVRSRFATEVGRVTPKISADAAVFNESGQILLQKRADDGTWCLPGGYAEPNEAPHETAVRETKEETGLTVTAGDLVGVYTRKPGEFGPHCLVIHLYRCTIKRGTVEVSREGEDVQYWSLNTVPDWHKNHEQQARDAYTEWKQN
ncbi:NUDIX hydrolase N-terminal domain-containing protein [Halomicrococcus sp. NG-SE-24]|uniref:NUDIX hydrolase N-terminal domain-containing protein n=1 Tax=Halomicrococcus sp. NG-SE-24 TaxID=3436928 RepID=UPI003D979E79